MTSPGRAQVVSSFTVIKGAMVDETYAAFSGWDLSKPKRENLTRLKDGNYIGASSETWLRDVAKVINRRFDTDGRDRPLVFLAQSGWQLDEWKPLLLWHMTRDEFLVRDFLRNWLFPVHESGAYRVRPEELEDYLEHIADRGGITEHRWSNTTIARVATGLLKIAVDFDLMRGAATKEFVSYHLPERSFLYLLHAVSESERNPTRVIQSTDWRMFLMTGADVERELLRLHQFHKVEYQVAGTLVELRLPFNSPKEFAESSVA